MSCTLLALDAGTTGVTACLFDQELRLVARSYREFEQHFPRPGWIEHEGHEILAAVDAVLAEILQPLAPGERPRAMGLTNQRETVFALERSTGKALGRGIVWQDRRTQSRCRELRAAGHQELVRERTGLLLDPYFSATKMSWMCEQDAGLAARAAAGEVVFGTVDTLVLAHLTDALSFSTDLTNASRTLLYDLEAKCWDVELCDLFGLDSGWLPTPKDSIGDFGCATADSLLGHEIPIRGVAGDQQAALFGQGCVAPGGLKSSFGTGSFLLLNTGGERIRSKAGLLSTLALGPGGESAYALEGSVFVAGAAVQWLRDNLGIIEKSSDVEALAASVADSGGVFFVPAFAGLGAPHWDADARGALVGLTRGSGRGHIARATLEAIAFQNVELIEAVRLETGLAVDELRADGGVASNDLFMQLLADLGGLRSLRAESVEATARGAAALAGIGAGVWGNHLEAGFYADALEAFEPTLGAEVRAARLGEWQRAVARVRSD